MTMTSSRLLSSATSKTDRDKKLLRLILRRKVVDSKTGCWFWVGRDGAGTYPYPRITIKSRSYLISDLLMKLTGKIKRLITGRRLFHCHTCDDGRCINPDHVFIAGPKANSQDAISKGRNGQSKKTHCKYGHPFDEVNTRVRGNNRQCRTCGRNAHRKKHNLSMLHFRGSYVKRQREISAITKGDMAGAIERAGPDRRAVAKELKISLKTLYKKFREVGLPIRPLRRDI